MKTVYTSAEIEVVHLDADDIIRTSTIDDEDEGELDPVQP